MLRLSIKPPQGRAYSVAIQTLPVRIGRSTRSDVRLEDPFASRLHAELRAEGSVFNLSDLGSGNGTFVNGKRIGTSALLRPGDVVQIGNTVLRLEVGKKGDTPRVVDLPTGDFIARPQLTRRESGTTTTRLTATLGGGGSGASTLGLPTMEAVLQAVRDIATSGEPASPPTLRSEGFFDVLGKVGLALLSPAGLEEVLNQILDLVFEAVEAERAYLMLQEGGGEGEEGGGLVCQLASFRQGRGRGREKEVRIRASIIEEVMKRGRPVLTGAMAGDSPGEGEAASLTDGRSVMAVPMALEGRILGMLYVDGPAVTGPFSDGDLQLLLTIGSIGAIKVENAVLLEGRLGEERRIQALADARDIQHRLLPVHPPPIPGYEVAGASLPCGDVGGDCFDYIARPDGRWLVILGDVSGRGLDAALLSSGLLAGLQVLTSAKTELPKVVEGLNRYLHARAPENRFATLFLGELDPVTHRLRHINAGHKAALLISNDGKLEELAASGLPLGIQARGEYGVGEVLLAPEDVLVIYSDGISEATNGDGERFTAGRLVEVVRRYRGALASELQELITQELAAFLGTAVPADDQTLVVIRRSG